MNYTPEQISQIVLKILKEIETPDVLKLSCKKKLNLAQDPNTSTETLAVLAIDKNPDVRLEVADHPNTSTESLAILATDKHPDVRYWVAQHPNTSTESLAILATDKNSFIRDVVSKHPNYKKQTLELTTKQYDALKKLIESSQDESLKGIV
jgi:hypothetical protein